jgi:hypothetical protein
LHHGHRFYLSPSRYMYFPCSRRQFGLLGPSLLEVGHDERAADGMLSSALVVYFWNLTYCLSASLSLRLLSSRAVKKMLSVFSCSCHCIRFHIYFFQLLQI